MSIESINTTKVESIPNYNPAASVAVSSIATGGQNQKGQKDPKDNYASVQQNTDDSLNLSTEAQTQVRELQQRDREVRTHEQAHVSAGGQYVRGGINYTYTRGPDNKQYATGGSVSLDTSPIAGDPDATIEKARVLRSAALAPSSPSAQDQSVAATASAMESEAKIEKVQEQGNAASTEQNKPTANQDKAKGAGNAGAQAENINATTPTTMPHNVISNTTFVQGATQSGATNVATHVNSTNNNINSALAAYKTQQRSAFMPTDLAPYGTGINLQV